MTSALIRCGPEVARVIPLLARRSAG